MKFSISLLLILSICLISCELDPDFEPGGGTGDLEAKFAFSNQSGTTCFAPCTVTFSNSSTGATNYSWNFGDGNSSTMAAPSHEFDLGGDYTVILTATDLQGNESKDSMVVSIRTPITFEKTYPDAGNQSGSAVIMTDDMGYALIGSNSEGGKLKGYFLRIDSLGEKLFGFPKEYEGENNYILSDISQTSDGGFVMTGFTTPVSGSDFQAVLIRTNQSGTEVWSAPKEFGDPDGQPFNTVKATQTVQLPDGGFALFGDSFNYRGGSGQKDLVYYRTNPGGDQTVFKYFTVDATFSDEQAGKWVFDGQNTFTAVGSSDDFPGSNGQPDFLILKFDLNGDLLNNYPKHFGTEGYDFLQAICVDPDGGFAAAGYTIDVGASTSDIYFVRIGSNGDPIVSSQNTFGGSSDEEIGSIIPTDDGNFLLVGGTKSFGLGGEDVYILVVNSSGDEVMSKTFGTFKDDSASGVVKTPDGGYLIFGSSRSESTNAVDFYVIKTDAKLRVL